MLAVQQQYRVKQTNKNVLATFISSPVLADAVTNPEALGENNLRHRGPLERLFVTCVDLTNKAKGATSTRDSFVVVCRGYADRSKPESLQTSCLVRIWVNLHIMLQYMLYPCTVPGVPGFRICRMLQLCVRQTWSMLSLVGLRDTSVARVLDNPSRNM